MTTDTSAWTAIGRTSNAEFFEVEPGVLAVVPFEGVTDNAATARESIALQVDYLRSHGRRAGVLVMIDRVLEQDTGARAVYREAPDPAFQACFALVGRTVLGRAVGSVFLGLHPPRVPTRMFGTVDEAVRWIRQTLATR